MLSQLKEQLTNLEGSDEFKGYREKHPDSYLTAGLIIVEHGNLGDWQVNFYSPHKHKITTFVLKDTIEVKKEDEIFQKDRTEVEQLDLKKVRVDLEKALGIVKKLDKAKYSDMDINKVIAVLQTLNHRQLWNITCLTSTLKVLNVKIDAEDSRIIEESSEGILGFRKK